MPVSGEAASGLMKSKIYIDLKSKGLPKKIVLPALLLLLGISIGFVLRDYSRSDGLYQHFEVREKGHSFTNPLLECASLPEASENDKLRPFKHKIEDLREGILGRGQVTDIAIYFRDLNNGPWVSIDPRECFAPSSLLKVPTLMSFLKEAETNPSLLKKKIKYQRINNLDLNEYQLIRPQKTLEPGKEYAVEELLYRMVAYSDNNATATLQGSIAPAILDRTYRDLGVRNPYVRGDEYILSVELCASFFRILFNASYLNKEMSEKALSYLSKVQYKEGIVAGVPSHIQVSHKFGERALGNNDEIKQLHDCGIVYYPNHPYLLCVLTNGGSFESLSETIREISHFVYQEIDDQHLLQSAGLNQ